MPQDDPPSTPVPGLSSLYDENRGNPAVVDLASRQIQESNVSEYQKVLSKQKLAGDRYVAENPNWSAALGSIAYWLEQKRWWRRTTQCWETWTDFVELVDPAADLVRSAMERLQSRYRLWNKQQPVFVQRFFIPIEIAINLLLALIVLCLGYALLILYPAIRYLPFISAIFLCMYLFHFVSALLARFF
jgi:hypothetical protein